MDWLLEIITELPVQYVNIGIATGLLALALLLLRPVLARTVSPRLRVVLWGVVWVGGYFPAWYGLFSVFHILPVTLRDLITPRLTWDGLFRSYYLPAYLPLYQGDGTYNVAFPGGGTVMVPLKLWMPVLLLVVWVAGIFWVGRRFQRQTDQLKKAALRGRLLSWEGPELAQLDMTSPANDSIQVRLCRDLPTSFLYTGWEKAGRRAAPVIYLQEGLPRERMALVLRHELNHKRLHHAKIKGIAAAALALYWWNPILWIAYQYLCLDLELDCDRATMGQLTAQERQEYAKTLLELGAGKQLWNVPLAFGESDGAKRVKAALSWQKRDFFVEGAWRQKNFWLQAAQWTVFALTLLLLLGGPRERFIPRDVLLNMDRQYGCVQELVKELNGNLPSYAPVREGWLQVREENLVVMALHLDDGRWLKAVYFRYKGTWGCDGREWMDAAPDLAGYVPFYPEDQSLVP